MITATRIGENDSKFEELYCKDFFPKNSNELKDNPNPERNNVNEMENSQLKLQLKIPVTPENIYFIIYVSIPGKAVGGVLGGVVGVGVTPGLQHTAGQN